MPDAKTVPTRRLIFRVEDFERIAGEFGHKTDADRARFLGLHQSQYSRVSNGTNLPGEVFIAAVLAALPQMPFERLFEVVEVQR